MLNDLSIGLEDAARFENFCREHPEKTGFNKVEFSVQVLTTGHWPQNARFDEINLPLPMQRCVSVFKEYYESKYTSNRRITWTFSLGSATLRGYFGVMRKSYDIQVHTLQAVVLLLFNSSTTSKNGSGSEVANEAAAASLSNSTTMSFVSIMEALNMPEEVLKKTLHSLSCGKFKVLKKYGTGEAGEKDSVIRVTDSFAVNDQFS